MLSKLPVIVAVTAFTLAGDAVLTSLPTNVPSSCPIVEQKSETTERASLTGCLLSWNGLGSADALLGPETLGRVGIVIEGPKSIFSPELDGRGRFHLLSIAPGKYEVKVLWDGRLSHTHGLKLSAMDSAVAEIRVQESSKGAKVAIRTVGATIDEGKHLQWSSTNEENEMPLGDELENPELPSAPMAPVGPRALGIRPPAETTLFELEDGDWADDALPSTLPEMLDTQLIIDPDVNVSKLHQSDPLGGIGGEIQAI